MTTDPEMGDLLLRVAGIFSADEFSPFVIRAAHRCGVRGWIRLDAAGALIRVIGLEDQLVHLVRAIRDGAPASSRVRSMSPELITPDTPAAGDGFTVLVEEGVDWHDPEPCCPPLAHVA